MSEPEFLAVLRVELMTYPEFFVLGMVGTLQKDSGPHRNELLVLVTPLDPDQRFIEAFRLCVERLIIPATEKRRNGCADPDRFPID